MKNIVFTGSTSFTGSWFVKELARAGYAVSAPLKREKSAYTSLRKTRLEWIETDCQTVENCPFGSKPFFEWIEELPSVDFFCHHAAEVTNYKSPDFDPIGALKNNTYHLKELLPLLKKKGCQAIVLTGSVFEPGEGAGSELLRAVSPYGLSKGLTSSIFEYYTALHQIPLKKFVIPNPFGPLEEVRFTTFLAQNWLQGRTPPVTHPSYVRDNIPVSLLAKAYVQFLVGPAKKLSPSCYAGPQKDFVLLFAKEMKKRLQIPCEIDFQTQVDFNEPRERINTDRLDPAALGWNEEIAWDELADFYLKSYSHPLLK